MFVQWIFSYVLLSSHLKRFPSSWIGVLDFLFRQLLRDHGELMSLKDQLLFELFLGFGLQELLSEENV